MDEDLFLAIQMSQECESVENCQKTDDDYQYALKLSEELNKNQTNSSLEHDDFLLALRLSKENDEKRNEDCSKSVMRKSFDLTNDHSSNKFSISTLTGAVHDFKSNISDEDFLLAVQIAESKSDELTRPKTIKKSRPQESSGIDHDFLLALQLAEQGSDDEKVESDSSAVKMERSLVIDQNVEKYSNSSLSVVDSSWELIDPNPDIYSLFAVFNKRFFWGRLDMVEVKWSPQMTSCAGICSYSRRAGYCVVRLSKPLLSLRSRKDLVETLLHEMIHAYLFVIKNDEDRDGHGPEFHKHMYRINEESGSNITVYHSFHDEVKFYKTHWWKCDGPCAIKPPFFGLIKRARNRAPSPNDFWWADHQASCGGNFHKIAEPEGYGKKKSSVRQREKTASDKTEKKPNVLDLLKKAPSMRTSEADPLIASNIASKGSTFNETISSTVWPLSSSTSSSIDKSSPGIVNKVSFADRNINRIFTLSDLDQNKRKRSTSQSPSKSPKKWIPIEGQTNILRFLNRS